MINRVVKKITRKEIVFINRHRNSIPIIEDNLDKYVFFDPGFLWRVMGIVGRRSKLRYRLMYMLLSLVQPVWIIEINWIEKLQSLYLVWANRHNKQFIVLQHGIYYGGIMRDIDEKYVKCNIMLVWGDYFRDMFLENNRGKTLQCVSFGNPIYNQFERDLFNYPEGIGNRILLVPSYAKGHRYERFVFLIEKLLKLGFDVTVKEHYMQSKKLESFQVEECSKAEGDDFHLYRLLQSHKYDIVITDVSTAMTDIIFFKNRTIYFSPDFDGEDFNENIYNEYLSNLNDSIDGITSRSDIFSYLNVESQEKLLKRLIKLDNLSNDLSQLEE